MKNKMKNIEVCELSDDFFVKRENDPEYAYAEYKAYEAFWIAITCALSMPLILGCSALYWY